jgi:hypothetical protein
MAVHWITEHSLVSALLKNLERGENVEGHINQLSFPVIQNNPYPGVGLCEAMTNHAITMDATG